MNFQVLQRDARGKAAVSFGGECRATGEVRVRVCRGKSALPGFSWVKAGGAWNGGWEARLSGIPTGGPYNVEAVIRARGGRKAERAAVREILVGDLWVMAGQSNMEGQGAFDCALQPHPLVRMFAKRGEWVPAKEPTHFWLESPDQAHWYGMNEAQWKEALAKPQPKPERGASPGLAFGRALVDATGIPVGLIPTALGGSSMEQWNPAYKDKGTQLLFGSMLAQLGRTGAPPVAGILWWQGESEAFAAELVPPFHEAFLKLVRAFRDDLKQPDLPFIYAQISRVCGMGVDWKLWNAVQEAQRKAAGEIPFSACVASVDLPLDDGIHVSGYGQNILGMRMAKAALHLRFGKKILPGPAFQKAELFGPENKTARVFFGGVNGKMSPERHIAGFTVRDLEGNDLSLVYEARPDPERQGGVILHLDATPPAGAQLWYGWGRNPYCNLVDGEGMAALTFGPALLQQEMKVPGGYN